MVLVGSQTRARILRKFFPMEFVLANLLALADSWKKLSVYVRHLKTSVDRYD